MNKSTPISHATWKHKRAARISAAAAKRADNFAAYAAQFPAGSERRRIADEMTGDADDYADKMAGRAITLAIALDRLVQAVAAEVKACG